MPLNDLWGNRLDLLNRHRKLLLAAVLMFDAYLGLNKGAGAIVWSGFLNRDLIWMFQSAEMMVGGLLIIHIIFSSTKEKWGLLAVFPPLILLVVLVLGTLELLLSGLGRSATVNFNLSAISMSGLYWTAA